MKFTFLVFTLPFVFAEPIAVFLEHSIDDPRLGLTTDHTPNFSVNIVSVVFFYPSPHTHSHRCPLLPLEGDDQSLFAHVDLMGLVNDTWGSVALF